jgi:hypothetical protein
VTGDPAQWLDPSAFELQPAGRLGDVGRNELTGPDLRTVDLAFVKRVGWDRLAPGGRVELRVEVFNLFDRVNFGPPNAVVFSGIGGDQTPLATFGQIRSTVTSARQVQLGVRIAF